MKVKCAALLFILKKGKRYEISEDFFIFTKGKKMLKM